MTRTNSAIDILAQDAAQAYSAAWERAKAGGRELDVDATRRANESAWRAVVSAVLRGIE